MKIIENENIKFVLIDSDNIEINSVQDAVDYMGNANYMNVNIIIAKKENFSEDFFDLKTKIAGETLQKFSNYKMKLGIIGDFSNIQSKSLKDFIYESNKNKQIVFVSTIEEALKQLSN